MRSGQEEEDEGPHAEPRSDSQVEQCLFLDQQEIVQC
jgi:hypothetical protein